MSNEEIIRRVRNGLGDGTEMEVLYLKNKGLIYKLAERYKGNNEIDDLMQEGYFALVDSVENYDPKRGAPFHTYFALRLKWHFIRYNHGSGDIIRLPEYLQNKAMKYFKIKNELIKELGRQPDHFEIAEELDIDFEELDRLEQALEIKNTVSIYSPVTAGEDLTLIDIIEDDRNNIVELEDRIQNEQLKRDLWNAVNNLPEESSQTIRKIYGEGKTMNETAQDLNTTMTRIRANRDKGFLLLRRDKALQTYFNDDVYYTLGLRPVGVERFRNTRVSSVESAVMLLEERRKRGDFTPTI